MYTLGNLIPAIMSIVIIALLIPIPHTDATYNYYYTIEPWPNQTIIKNANATNPTYADLLRFVASDKIYEKDFVHGSFTCIQFAIELHDDAECYGYIAHLTYIGVEGDNAHECVAFNTTDKGLVFIDSSGLTSWQKQQGFAPHPRVLTIIVGESIHATYFTEPDQTTCEFMQGNVTFWILQD